MDSIKTNFSELLTAFSSEDSITISIAFLMTWLIGWLMRYLWDRSKIGGLRDTLTKSEQEKNHFKGEWEKLQDKYALQEADLKKSNLELTNKSIALEAADGEKRTLNSRLNATLVDLDKSKEEFQETSGRLEDLNDQILGLRTKNAQLSAIIEEKTNTNEIYSLTADTAKYEQEAADLASENILLKNSIEALKANLVTEGTTGATLRLSQLETENENLKAEIATSLTDSTETAELQAKLATLTAENEDLKVQIATPASETTELQAELATLDVEKEKLADALAEVAQLEGGNEALNMTINNLIAENEQLKDQVETIPQYEAGNEALNNSMQTLITENEDLQTNAEAIIQYEAGNEVLNATITELIEKNEALEAQLTSQVNNRVEWSVDDNQAVVEEATGVLDEDIDMDVETSKAKLRAAIGAQIPQATTEERDDLKQINGVGPFIEEKLNDLGIYTFEQISQLDEELIETLTNAIEFFPGRIERDDWVGQADRLFYTKGSAPQEMNHVPTKMATSRYANATERIELSATPIPTRKTAKKRRGLSKPDDLKRIEGIGPKISQILNTAGIYTFSNLSQTPVDRLKGILAEAGNRYKIHNPQTWPQQAELAATGAWEELKILQDRLDGGRDVAKG
ncbi:MAG: helix-hairpin-helix domain-containing protein [Saprospiraceae bacterium]